MSVERRGDFVSLGKTVCLLRCVSKGEEWRGPVVMAVFLETLRMGMLAAAHLKDAHVRAERENEEDKRNGRHWAEEMRQIFKHLRGHVSRQRQRQKRSLVLTARISL